MSTEIADSSESASPRTSGIRENWINPGRIRFWAIVLIVLYTLAGFFLVPALIKSTVIKRLAGDLGREARIQKVETNPYALSLRVSGFALDDTDGVELASFDELFVNFQASSLFRWALTFKEIRLDGFHALLERYAPGDSRLTRLLADAAANRPPEEIENEEISGLPRLLIHKLSLNEGRATFRDDVPETPVQLDIGPFTVSMLELNTLPDRYGQQSVVVHFPGEAILSWQGSISLGPLESEGELLIENSHLGQTIAYLKAMLPLESIDATLSARMNYRIMETPGGALELSLDGLEAELSDVAVSGLTPRTEFLSFSSLSLYGGMLRYPENVLKFSSAGLSDPYLGAWLSEEGELSLSSLAPAAAESDPDTGPPAGEPTQWRIGIDEFTIENGSADFSDNSVQPAAGAGIRNLQLELRDISNEEGAVFPVRLDGALEEGGRFGFEGEIGVLPELSIVGSPRAGEIPLALAQPYLQKQFQLMIEDGVLDAQAEIGFSATTGAEASGSFAVAGLQVLDTVENEPLLGWGRLDVDRFELDAMERSLRFSQATFDQLYSRIEIEQDRSVNINRILQQTTSDQTESESESTADPWSIVVGAIAINDASMDFSDLSLPLQFATYITSMDGSISTLDTRSVEPANIRLEGQVDEYGLARIDGSIGVFDPIAFTDITLEFRNLLMSKLSPYTIQFAGQEIDEGKLDLDLRYFIDKGQLRGQNAIVLSDLVLGDKVDHPDAASLPLGLAVALLKDSNGVIDIDLPVEGDVNDPEFRIGGVVWQAIAGLITKVVSAPFRLLGSLIGVESEDFGQFQFLAGRSDLTPPELEKIAQLQQALQQRPELSIEVSGAYAPGADRPRLQYFRLRDLALERLGKEPVEGESETEMLDAEVRAILEVMFRERFPESDPETLKATHTGPPADDPEGKPELDELAYAQDLWERLLASEEITTADLRTLADQRAEAIRSAFLASGEYDETRIALGDATETESEDDEWVIVELGVATN